MLNLPNSTSTTVRESRDVDVRGRRGGGGGGVNVFCVCVELGDWTSEKLSGRVKLEGHSPKWRALQNFSFQPCVNGSPFNNSLDPKAKNNDKNPVQNKNRRKECHCISILIKMGQYS